MPKIDSNVMGNHNEDNDTYLSLSAELLKDNALYITILKWQRKETIISSKVFCRWWDSYISLWEKMMNLFMCKWYPKLLLNKFCIKHMMHLVIIKLLEPVHVSNGYIIGKVYVKQCIKCRQQNMCLSTMCNYIWKCCANQFIS